MTRKVNFVIAGFQKAGTTALYRFLCEHPAVYMPERKEQHFFDGISRRDVGNFALYEDSFRPEPWHTAIGEATPSYAFFPDAIVRLHRYNPEMKIILILREPVARAWSQYQMDRQRGYLKNPFFVEVLLEALRMLRNTHYPELYRSLLARGLYHEQVLRVIQTFGEDCLLCLTQDRLRQDHDAVMAEVFAFIGVDTTFKVQPAEIIPVKRDTAYRPLPKWQDYLLRRFFASNVRRTEQLTGLNLKDWFYS